MSRECSSGNMVSLEFKHKYLNLITNFKLDKELKFYLCNVVYSYDLPVVNHS